MLRCVPVLLLAGCATTYQPSSFSGGFSETRLDQNVFRVSFKGNGYTDPQRAEDFALLRSAELALKHGFTHFALMSTRSDKNVSSFTTPTQTITTGTATAVGNTAYGQARSVTTGGQTFVTENPTTTNTIFCFSGKPDGVFAYDAAFLVQSLSEKYGLKLAP